MQSGAIPGTMLEVSLESPAVKGRVSVLRAIFTAGLPGMQGVF